jgi:serine/threonine protein kinase
VGATSDVSIGVDEHLDREVAVKVLRGETADRRRFTAEAQLLAGLDHPNLVHLYDAIDSDDAAVLVMEFVDGPSLAEVLNAGPLPADRVALLGSQLARGLAYLHVRGVVHRDVKPANILLAPDGAARLGDFGIARLVDATRLTVTGQSIGTPTYMSPEQLTGGAVGPETDVYALGLVLLEARTGRRAFPGKGHEAVAARLARAPDLPVGELGRGWRVCSRP